MSEIIQRRDFLAASLASAVGVAAMPALAAQAGGEEAAGGREYCELRVYRLRRGPMQKRLDDYFRDALLPALGRLGAGPVGVFNVVLGPDSPSSYLLIPHRSVESLATLGERLMADAEYRQRGSAFLDAAATDPSYVTMESSLMVASAHMPRIEPPGAGQARILELRTYRSHSERAFRKKVEMFGPGGELAIFRRVGLRPVFFAETLVGRDMPNLTYMLSFPDLATRERNWGVFGGDPEWRKLSATPGYTDPEIVASISSVFLRPAGYSQI